MELRDGGKSHHTAGSHIIRTHSLLYFHAKPEAFRTAEFQQSPCETFWADKASFEGSTILPQSDTRHVTDPKDTRHVLFSFSKDKKAQGMPCYCQWKGTRHASLPFLATYPIGWGWEGMLKRLRARKGSKHLWVLPNLRIESIGLTPFFIFTPSRRLLELLSFSSLLVKLFGLTKPHLKGQPFFHKVTLGMSQTQRTPGMSCFLFPKTKRHKACHVIVNEKAQGMPLFHDPNHVLAKDVRT